MGDAPVCVSAGPSRSPPEPTGNPPRGFSPTVLLSYNRSLPIGYGMSPALPFATVGATVPRRVSTLREGC